MSAHRRPYLGALILITLGVLFLLDNLGVADFGTIISTYWPLILILIGVRIFFRYGRSPVQSTAPGTMGTGATLESTASALNNSNVFGDVDLKINSKEFRGGSVSTTFGDMNIDLSEIALAEGEQVLKIDGVFGDLHILVPKDIEIFVTTHSVFGDVRVLGNIRSGFGQEISYSSPNYSSASKKLRVVSNQVFGDVKVW